MRIAVSWSGGQMSARQILLQQEGHPPRLKMRLLWQKKWSPIFLGFGVKRQQKKSLEEECNHLKQRMHSSSEALRFIHQDFQRHGKTVDNVLDSISTDILGNLESLNLTHEQEDFLTETLRKKMENLLELNNKSLQIEESMQSFIEELAKG